MGDMNRLYIPTTAHNSSITKNLTLPPQLNKVCRTFIVRKVFRCRSDYDDHCRRLVEMHTMSPVHFSDQPFDPVSLDRRSHAFSNAYPDTLSCISSVVYV